MAFTKPKPLSGFPEWLPEDRAVELAWLDSIRRVFESHGFASIETPSVEAVDVLAAKGGDADKEIYGVRRLNAEPGEAAGHDVALHYDLTVPMARYVAQHFDKLSFPFKRYQIQRAWRGERPQEGRFREFYQCDIDVVDLDEVALQFDADIPLVMLETLRALKLERVAFSINNRKILQGFYEGIGIGDIVGAIRIVDKMDKIGPEGVRKALADGLSLAPEIAGKCVALAEIKTADDSFVERVRAFGASSEQLNAGLEELAFVMKELRAAGAAANVAADLSIARGFDYYTGTVYEGKLMDFPGYPSICSGGRYDNLVGSFSRQRLPGIGMSLGLTRLFSKLHKEGLLARGAASPAHVLVVQLPGLPREQTQETARRLRARGWNVEAYHKAAKLDKQIQYATRKGIPNLWFPGSEGRPDEVKNLAARSQAPADVETWRPG
jgi:histidyl-tRNA synthetase